MNKKDVKVGMKVVFTEDFYIWKVGDTLTVESIGCDGYPWTSEDLCIDPLRVRPATPEDIAPRLWQSYKHILNDEALAALEQVILGPWTKELCFVDVDSLSGAFNWHETEQGFYFWTFVKKGYYNKQEEPEVNKFDFTNTKIDLTKYADENGITLLQAIRDIESLAVFNLGVDTDDLPQFLYSYSGGKSWRGHNSKELFDMDNSEEITIKRNTSLTACFVPEETITLPGGKVVSKKDYDDAIANLKPFIQ